MPQISILMPVYNAEKFIKKTIVSVLSQSFVDFEFIIVDDGSIDNSFEIISSFKDERIKYFRNERNSGIVFSLNKALEIAKGEYIARIDADDICTEDRLKLQFDFLEENKNVGVCSGHIQYIDSNDVEGLSVEMPVSFEECKIKFLFGNPVIHPASMFRKDLALKVGGYTAGMEPAEDYDFWLKLLEVSEIQNIDKLILQYRTHSTNYSSVRRKDYNSKFREIFKKDSKLKFLDIIDEQFINFHIRLIIGTWNEKSSLKEVFLLRKWKRSLISNNKKLKVFDQHKLLNSINYNITLILMVIIKSKYNTYFVKLLAAVNLFLFDSTNVIRILKEKR